MRFAFAPSKQKPPFFSVAYDKTKVSPSPLKTAWTCKYSMEHINYSGCIKITVYKWKKGVKFFSKGPLCTSKGANT